jgi:hypothetical protein
MTSEIMISVSLLRGRLRHFCGFAIFLAMVSAATAAERVLPRQMLGTWCGVPAEWQEIDKRVFERGKCDPEDDTSILVRPDGYQGMDFSCKIIEISSKREGARIV